MAGASSILIRRAIILTFALIVIVFLTGVIMEATGYAENVWRAIIDARVRAYTSALQQKAHGGMYCESLGTPYKAEIQGASLQLSTTNGVYVYSGILTIPITQNSQLNYTSTKYPPSLPTIVMVNPLLIMSNGNVESPIIYIKIIRPDGIEAMLYNNTIPTKEINITQQTGKIKLNTSIIISANTNLLAKDLAEKLSEKYLGGEKLTIPKGEIRKYLYSVPSKNATKISLTPLYGDYKVVVQLMYGQKVENPIDLIAIKVEPPTKCQPITQLIQEYRERLFKQYQLDKPWYVRVVPLVINTLTGNLGETNNPDVTNVAGMQSPAPVSAVILACLPRTVIMLTIAELICMAIALPLAPKIAYHYGTRIDRLVVSYAALFNAIPVWWLGLVFIFLFSYQLHIFPATGRPIIKFINTFTEDPLGNLARIIYYVALPIITIVITFLGGWLYSVRAVVLRIIREDFVTVAKAKGLPESMIVKKYIVRVAAPPIVTYIILALAGSLSGMIITESVFDYPGMGTLYYAAIQAGDVPTILGLTYVLTGVYIAARFFLEVLYILLDPRVRL